jgi:ankyrin repeat protein
MVAARDGDNERLLALLEQGARVNRGNSNGGTPLMYAALSGNPETVGLLLAHGAKVNAAASNGWTALMIAAVKGHARAAQVLLEQGALANRPDVYGWTPLMRAVREKRAELVRLLADHPPTRINLRGENGLTALHLAVLSGREELVRILLGAGADPRQKDDAGRTSRDLAQGGSAVAALLEAALARQAPASPPGGRLSKTPGSG